MEFVYFSILFRIRFGSHFLAPPAGSDSPFGLAGPKSRKSNNQTYFNIKLSKINKFHMGKRTPAGSVSGLRPSQGQSREKVTTKPTLI